MAPLPDLTKNQTLVLDALTRVEGPASAYLLLDRLREHGFRAPLQVYRALEKLIEYGLVHRLESLNSFVACAHPHEHAHGHRHGLVAFAICENCGQVDEFSDATVEKRLRGWANDHAFKLSKTTIEMRGTCANCLAQ
jgi:Fur family zinc uptake transcriptional regulator